MNKILSNYAKILRQIDLSTKKYRSNYIEPNLIAVSKTFPEKDIQVLIDQGHKIFGENKVQEAEFKWGNIKKINKEKQLELHLIGPLQSNKVNKALEIFDVIQTLDREKIALKIRNYLDNKKLTSCPRFLVQINIGNEIQKSGVNIEHTKDFVEWCTKDLKLKIIGLMCIPPVSKEPSNFFIQTRKLCDELNLKHASMGMTSDFQKAIQNGSTFIRVGSGIFGSRN